MSKEAVTTEPDNLVSIVERISDKRFIETFSRLWELAAWQHHEVMKDPYPFLRKAAEEGAKSQKLKHQIMDIIYPAPDCKAMMINEAPQAYDERLGMREKLDKIYKLVSQ